MRGDATMMSIARISLMRKTPSIISRLSGPIKLFFSASTMTSRSISFDFGRI
jgi:hypothetical protein